MSHAELTDDQVEELRMWVADFDQLAASGPWSPEISREYERMKGAVCAYRHEILASLDQLGKMRRRMRKGVG